MPSENKVVMTRVIFGVASVGATLALVYLYNKYQQRKRNDGSSSSAPSISRNRRQSGKSGEVKKVTFKTTHDGEEVVESSGKVNSTGTSGTGSETYADNNSKLLLSKELNQPQPSLRSDCESKPVPQHAPRSGGEGHPSGGHISSTSRNLSTATDDDSSNTTTNIYESNSTLKLEDSINTHEGRGEKSVDVAAKEEVITRSSEGPLMTSTPLPGKESSSIAPLRGAQGAAPPTVFEPHSDLRPAAQVEQASKNQSPALGVTPETDYESFAFRKEMQIPREFVPGLIGKKGCNIKAIQTQSGTTINFHDETLDNGDRICVIRGAPANVTIAESLIEKFIIEQPIIYTETLTVPLSAVGRIIGRGGETIRSIQDLSKARVNVESHNHYGTDSGPTRQITIKGSEEQITIAKQLIIEKVDEERTLRKTIDQATASRTPRRGGNVVTLSGNSASAGGPFASASTSTMSAGSTDPVLPSRKDGILEVFVSCVYHPNDFWIQVVGRDSIELDKLCESMTDYYEGRNEQADAQFSVGDIVAAPFEVDSKMYRAKIMRIDEKEVEVSYLDYGDQRVLPITEIYELHPNFLRLRFQAIQATLNLGCIGDKWEDNVINAFCDLTYCAQWQSLTARVKDYLKDVEDGHDVIWIELLDKDINVGDELVRKGLATPKGPSGCNGAQPSLKKSYAAVALGVGSSSTPTEPLITALDPTVQESLENERNGN